MISFLGKDFFGRKQSSFHKYGKVARARVKSPIEITQMTPNKRLEASSLQCRLHSMKEHKLQWGFTMKCKFFIYHT